MKILYTAPNRGHHYHYAASLARGGLLHKFVSGFSRFSPRSELSEIGNKLVRADILQNLYLASLRFHFGSSISSKLAYMAKIEQDSVCKKYIEEADMFLFYSGSGLSSCKEALKRSTITIVEAVNSHVTYQQDLLKGEYHSLNIPWKPFYKPEVERRLEEYDLADYILLPSEFVKNSFLKLGFPEKKLIKVPYGFNQLNKLNSMSQFEDKVANDDFTILYVGSISVRKGLRYLIEAFQGLQHPKKRMFIVGPQSAINGLNGLTIPEGVTFTGVLKGAALEDVYRNASVFCLPSIEEGLALVLGEALSFGIPIIATENTGVNDIITNCEEGFVVPIRDSRAIAEKLQLLVDDPLLRRQMKENALKKSRNLDGWDEAGKLLNLSLGNVYNTHKQ
jgi:starch synthase